jgi:hypothetical protein
MLAIRKGKVVRERAGWERLRRKRVGKEEVGRKMLERR